MIDIDLPDLPPHVLDFVPEDVPVRDYPAEEEDLPSPAGRVVFEGPRAVPVTAQYVAKDPELEAFVVGEAPHSSYYLVHAALMLRADDDEPPFESDVVRMRLSAGNAAAPIAWSIRPQRVAETAEVTTGWQLGPKLSIADVAGFELGSMERSTTETHEEVYLESRGELGSTPEWLLHRTANRPLRGSHRLIMVVRAPRGAVTEATITVRTRVRARQLLWHRSRDLNPVVISTTF